MEQEWAAALADEPDPALLRVMADRVTDAEAARGALRVFYERHREFLFRVCRRVCVSTLHDAGLAEDLVHDTMWAVFEESGTFDPGKLTRPTDPDYVRRGVRLWVARRAHWVACRIARGNESRPVLRLVESSALDAGHGGRGDDGTRAIDQYDEVIAILGRLPERERRVVMLTMLLRDPDTGEPVDPDGTTSLPPAASA